MKSSFDAIIETARDGGKGTVQDCRIAKLRAG